MRVLRDDLGLEPVEFATTRLLDASPQARAADLMEAFADPSISAVLATIGGDDQLTVLPYLDPDVVASHPTAFFGYSDNTNLLNWLWNLGIVGYHGGSTMVHLARSGGVSAVSLGSLRRALFDTGEAVLAPVAEFTDAYGEWSDPDVLTRQLAMSPEPGWAWHNADTVVTGPSIRPVDDYAGCVLLLETSEEMPSAEEVFRMMRNAGERGLLEQFPAIVVAKPKAWNHERDEPEEERAAFRAAQQEAILRAAERYCPATMIVFGADFGHTDPQYVLPYGGRFTVDGPARRITYAL